MFRKSAQVAARPETQVEELFLQYYDRMLEWALHLTDHRAEQAEDLASARASEGDSAKTPSPFGSGAKARAGQNALKKYRRRLREVYEHEPSELRVAVNGFTLAQQEVSGALSKQTLGIEVADELTLIEVLSEQGVRLLALHVEPPPDGPFEQRARAELSDGRVIEAHLSFCGSWPHLQVIYDCGTSDCGLRPLIVDDCGLEKVADSPCDSPQLLFNSFAKPQGLFARLQSAIRNPQSAIRAVLLAVLLITVAVGQRLGWWLASPSKAPLRREAGPGKAIHERPAQDAPAVEAVPGKTEPPTTAVPAPSAGSSTIHATAIAELEVEALGLLRQAGADLGEQVEVKLTAQGRLLIEGLVEIDERKAELLHALRSLANHPAVVIHIETVAEAVARRRAPGKRADNETPDDESRIEVEKTALPIAAELRIYLQARGAGASEDEIHGLAARLYNQARRALDHLYALQRLSKQIGPTQCDALGPEAQAKFLGLLSSHAGAYAAKSQRLREELAAILNTSTPLAETPDAIQNTAELYRAVGRLCALGKSAHAALDRSLTISGQPAAPIKSPTFWRALADAEALAAQIAAYTTQHQPTERKQ